MSCLAFCTCPATDCEFHPKHHADGCTPCIKKNLEHHEIPACFWFKIDENADNSSDYSFHKFANKVVEVEGVIADDD